MNCVCAATRSPLCEIHATQEEKHPRRVYARYVGTRACLTNRYGGFVMVERDELSGDEKAACEAGGGYVTLSEILYGGLDWK